MYTINIFKHSHSNNLLFDYNFLCFTLQWVGISFNWNFQWFMDLSMIGSNEEPFQIIISTEFSVHSLVMGFQVYSNIRQAKIGEILKTYFESGNKVLTYWNYRNIEKETRIIGHLPIVISEKYAKILFTLWWVEHSFSRAYWKGGEQERSNGYESSLPIRFHGKCQNDWNTKEYYL